MRNLTKLINEERKNYDSTSLLRSEITKYINSVKKKLPVNVQKAIYLTSKYNITSGSELDKIRLSNKSNLKNLVDEFNIPLNELEDLWNLMKSMKGDFKYMPQYISKTRRNMIEQGKMALDDLTMDLKTQTGRNAVAKMYTPLVYTIVNQFVGKSRLDKPSLISAGMMGLADAINNWKDKPDSKTGKIVPFKTFAGYRIRQAILNDINAHGHSLSGTNWYASDKYGAAMLDAVSLDGFNPDDETSQDRISGLGVEDKPDRDDESKWNKLYKLIDKKFSQRDADVFYKFFGLNGQKREKGIDIAKMYNTKSGHISMIVKKVVKYLKDTAAAKHILADIQDIYTESLMKEMISLSKQQIVESFTKDDIYLLLEEANPWKDKKIFMKSIEFALSAFQSKDQKILKEILNGEWKDLDDHIRKSNQLIRSFLQYVYPTESFANATDGDLMKYMTELQEYIVNFAVRI